ncbi:MAG: exopolyphosphatase / guanosine-5'-triphosphate 3'-diphosphate [Geobacteraceae bacterium]|nr:MAG: exopolyphosphatase / guanosine-5'-triphosphate 3'-diphosphate [Geobacteraceae bacterium]
MGLPAAAIDLGTNTVRLMIGRIESGSIEQLLLKRHITRLGGGFTVERGISREARERTVAALRDFAEEIKRHGITRVRAVATSAVRDATNGEEFCHEIFLKTGIRLDVIDGRKEGHLTLRGVLAGLDERPKNLMVFDVGGGSTEYTLTQEERPLVTMSLPLGVVRLTEGKVTREAMEDKIVRELNSLKSLLAEKQLISLLEQATLVGTAGTATTLAAISMKMTDYDYRRVNNYIIQLDEIKEIFAALLPMTPAGRLLVPGLEKGREDLIIAGILITIKTMEIFQFTRLKVSDFGLLEGLLLEA